MRLLPAVPVLALLLAISPAGLSVARAQGFTIDTDLNAPVQVSADELEGFFDHMGARNMKGMGQVFVEVGEQLGINPAYIAAHAALESGWGRSDLAKYKKNWFGYGAYDRCPYRCALSYANHADGVRQVMEKVKADYLTDGGQWFGGAPTLRGMNKRYATDKKWAYKIASIVQDFEDYRGGPVPAKQAPAPQPAPRQEEQARRPAPTGTPTAGASASLQPAAKANTLNVDVQLQAGLPLTDGKPTPPTDQPILTAIQSGQKLDLHLTVANRGTEKVSGVTVGVGVESWGFFPIIKKVLAFFGLDKWFSPKKAFAFPVKMGDIAPGESKTLSMQTVLAAVEGKSNPLWAWIKKIPGVYDRPHFDSVPQWIQGNGSGDLDADALRAILDVEITAARTKAAEAAAQGESAGSGDKTPAGDAAAPATDAR